MSSKPIAAKLIAKMKRSSRCRSGNLVELIDGIAPPDEDTEPVKTMEELVGYHPAHAPYISTQNHVSAFSEQLTGLKEMSPFVKILSEAEDLYSPGSPPMSPLTTSYFTCWAFFDACVGQANETIGTTILEVGEAFGVQSTLLRLIRLMQDSRMGLYHYRGRENGLAILEDFVTGAEFRAIVPAGYLGNKNELWYVRVLPPPFPGGQEHVVITTPYVVRQPGPREWQEYFKRNLPATTDIGEYERHMKYGPTRKYWNDYVFEAYVNYKTEVVFLAGLPDVPESRPCSKVNGWGLGREKRH